MWIVKELKTVVVKSSQTFLVFKTKLVDVMCILQFSYGINQQRHCLVKAKHGTFKVVLLSKIVAENLFHVLHFV
jgi:hypothetical protein